MKIGMCHSNSAYLKQPIKCIRVFTGVHKNTTLFLAAAECNKDIEIRSLWSSCWLEKGYTQDLFIRSTTTVAVRPRQTLRLSLSCTNVPVAYSCVVSIDIGVKIYTDCSMGVCDVFRVRRHL